jgi:hypothetical protein
VCEAGARGGPGRNSAGTIRAERAERARVSPVRTISIPDVCRNARKERLAPNGGGLTAEGHGGWLVAGEGQPLSCLVVGWSVDG